MKRYDSYKPSGVSWIPEVPDHWGKLKLSQVAKEHYISNKEIHHQNLLSLSYGKIVRRDINATDGLLPASFDTYQIVEPGNVVMRLTDLQNDHKSLRVGLVQEEGIVTSAYLTLEARNSMSPKFLYLFLHTADIHKYFYSLGSGIRQNLNFAGLRDISIIIPPLDEQEAIVSFLNSKTSKIDSYVAERERELDALEELRQTEVARVVTQGLNPDVPMRDSGIPWLGKIPAHWETKRAKNIFFRVQRPVRPEDEVITCFRDGQVTLRKNRRTEGFTEALQESGYQGIRKGDLVIHQMDAFSGSIGVSDSDGKGTPVYICCLPKFPLNIYYFSFIMREMARSGHIKSLYRGIRERSSDFRYETFAVQYLPIPPIEEQQAIVDYINAKTAKIDGLIADLSAQIEKLKEYKQRLIADAVTGQIDVRK